MEVEGDLFLAKKSMEVAERDKSKLGIKPNVSPATETNTTAKSTPTAAKLNQATPPPRKSDHRKSPDKPHPLRFLLPRHSTILTCAHNDT
jgi:hypothetical protein